MFELIALEKDALDILNFDGEITDTLAELRKKCGGISPLFLTSDLMMLRCNI